jgi:hypothetical protein
MDSLLSYAYLEEDCPHCRQTIPVTLYQILLEQQLQREWQPIRACERCTVPRDHAVYAVPERELGQLAAAWNTLRAVVTARGVRLQVGIGQPATPHRNRTSHA